MGLEQAPQVHPTTRTARPGTLPPMLQSILAPPDSSRVGTWQEFPVTLGGQLREPFIPSAGQDVLSHVARIRWPPALQSSSASLGATDYFKVDMLGLR